VRAAATDFRVRLASITAAEPPGRLSAGRFDLLHRAMTMRER